MQELSKLVSAFNAQMYFPEPLGNNHFFPQPSEYMSTTATLRTLTSPHLVNEVYIQLCKQTHRQPSEMLGYWQMLALIIPFSIPTGKDLVYNLQLSRVIY